MNLRDSLKDLVKTDAIYFEPCITRYTPVKNVDGNYVIIEDTKRYYLNKITSTVTVEPINRIEFPNDSPYPNYIYDVEYSPALEPAEPGTEVLVAFTNQGRGYIISSSKLGTVTAEAFLTNAKTLAEAQEDNKNIKLGSAEKNNADGYMILDREGFAIDLANQDGYLVLYKDGLYNYQSREVYFKSRNGVLVNLGGGSESVNLDLLVPPTGIVRMAKTNKTLVSSVFSTDTDVSTSTVAVPILKVPIVKNDFKEALSEIELITLAVMNKEDIANFNRLVSLDKLTSIEVKLTTTHGKKLATILKSYLNNKTLPDSEIISFIYGNITRYFTDCYEPILPGDLEKYLTEECKEEMVSVFKLIIDDVNRILKLGGYDSDGRLNPVKSISTMESENNRKVRDNAFNTVLRKIGSLRYGIVYLNSLKNEAIKPETTDTSDTHGKKTYEKVLEGIGIAVAGATVLAIAAPFVLTALGVGSGTLFPAAELGGVATEIFFTKVGGTVYTATTVAGTGAAVGGGVAGAGSIRYAIITKDDTDKAKQVVKTVDLPEASTKRTVALIRVLLELLGKTPPVDMVATTVEAEKLAKRDITISVSLLSIIEQLNTTIKEFGDSVTKVLSAGVAPPGGGTIVYASDPAFANTIASLTGNLNSLTKATESLLGTQSDYSKGKF